MGDLTKNFSVSEMQCKCANKACRICNIDKAFMERLQVFRDIAGIPCKVLSGCRCPSHNAACGGKSDSDHLTTGSKQCMGVDISCYSSRARFIILKAAIEAGFVRIGLAKTYIHLGISEELPQNVFWLY